MNLGKYQNLHRESSGLINVHPIQRGGILTPEARKVLSEFGDGYSVCDYCFEGRIDRVAKPPVRDLLTDISEFLGTEVARFTAGCRHAKSIVVRGMCEPGSVMVLDSLAHYTSYLAAEFNGVKIREVANSGHPDFEIKPGGYIEVIDSVEDGTGDSPALALLTHVDYSYGNLADAKSIGKVCRKRGVPLLLNTAYSSGLMPVDAQKLSADFICCSGHKSWASSASIGIVATGEEFEGRIFEKSSIRGDLSGKSFGKKEVACFGCSPVVGLPVMTLMASFPTVVQRVKRFGAEVENTRFLIDELEKIEGLKCMGQKPHHHTLFNMESLPFYDASQGHKKRGYILYHELKKRGIVGIHAGMTKRFKVNSYGLPREDIEKVAVAFQEIARDNNINVIG